MKEKNLQNLRARALRIELRPAFSSVELFFFVCFFFIISDIFWGWVLLQSISLWHWAGKMRLHWDTEHIKKKKWTIEITGLLVSCCQGSLRLVLYREEFSLLLCVILWNEFSAQCAPTLIMKLSKNKEQNQTNSF